MTASSMEKRAASRGVKNQPRMAASKIQKPPLKQPQEASPTAEHDHPVNTPSSDERPSPIIARVVSHQDPQYISENDEEEQQQDGPTLPVQHNPLQQPHSQSFRQVHLRALRLEAELFPMRQLIARLMSHPTYNRRGLFNHAVDPVALHLPDYNDVITRPMDLGTVKAKLIAVAYTSREEVAQDVLLVFNNAMTYNPPHNAVHMAAKSLKHLFQDAYTVLQATTKVPTSSNSNGKAMQKRLDPKDTFVAAAVIATRAAEALGPAATTAIVPLAGATTPLVVTKAPSTVTVNPSLTTNTVSSTGSSPSVVAVTVTPASSSTNPSATSTVAPITSSITTTPAGESAATVAASPSTIITTPAGTSVSTTNATLSTTAITGVPSMPQPISSKAILPQAPPQHCQFIKTKKRSSIVPVVAGPAPAEKALKRALNVAAKNAKHSCRSCLGRECQLCAQSCLSQEAALLICTGTNCLGAKIRKGAIYYIAKDGSRQFCQRCYTNLQAVLPHTADQVESFGSSVRYKRDLLKRKNEEEVAEPWLTCKTCRKGVHKICAMHNEFVHSEADYQCSDCKTKQDIDDEDGDEKMSEAFTSDYYTFVSGSEAPVKLDTILQSENTQSAESLPATTVSAFIQEKVRDVVAATGIAHAEETLTVRILSDCDREFKVPDVVRKHFRQQSQLDQDEHVVPPSKVQYNSKAITLFQKIDGLDVCIFCMYVQEYDCNDDDYGECPRGEQRRRVYVAYLDSVEHFRPRICRSEVFHEILVAYLATARARGYETAHIWACPPSRGNSFVFWNHPASQRTPNKERLISWYHAALTRGVATGTVTDVKSLFESSFPLTAERTMDPTVAFCPEKMALDEDGVLDGRLICPPLMEGDFWIEEAVRLHAASIVRHLKSKPKDLVFEGERCPAIQVGTMIREKVMVHDCAAPFRLPVNAAALKLTDYHKIISKPMDLGTVYSRCIHGEYEIVQAAVDDVELVFANAMRYNPKGHFVHNLAIKTRELFYHELNALIQQWNDSPTEQSDWKRSADVSMSLDNVIRVAPSPAATPDLLPVPTDESVPPVIEQPTASVLSKDSLKESITVARIIPESPPLVPVQPPAIQPPKLPSSMGMKPAASSASPTAVKKTNQQLHALFNTKLDFLEGGQDAIMQRMVGNDVWMMDKKNLHPSTGVGKKKNGGSSGAKRRKSDASEEMQPPAAKRRRQSWLGEEVGLAVRRMRTSFFTCSLTPKKNLGDEEVLKEEQFQKYVSSFGNGGDADAEVEPSRIADSRHAFLEFSQHRNLEFDTLRRAKYSTAVLLYHLHHDDAPGLIPTCTLCSETISEVRWHRIRRVEERHHMGRVPPTLRAARQVTVSPEVAEACHRGQELCGTCYGNMKTHREEFIPLPVSFKKP